MLLKALHDHYQACPPASWPLSDYIMQLQYWSHHHIPLEGERGKQDCHKVKKKKKTQKRLHLAWGDSRLSEENFCIILESYIRRVFFLCLLCPWVLQFPLLSLGWVHWMNSRRWRGFHWKGSWPSSQLDSCVLSWKEASFQCHETFPFDQLDVGHKLATCRKWKPRDRCKNAPVRSYSSSQNSVLWGRKIGILHLCMIKRCHALCFCWYDSSTWACFPASPVIPNCSADIMWLGFLHACAAMSSLVLSLRCLFALMWIMSCIYSHVSTLAFSKHGFRVRLIGRYQWEGSLMRRSFTKVVLSRQELSSGQQGLTITGKTVASLLHGDWPAKATEIRRIQLLSWDKLRFDQSFRQASLPLF